MDSPSELSSAFAASAPGGPNVFVPPGESWAVYRARLQQLLRDARAASAPERDGEVEILSPLALS